jgi:hypothetical protein
VSPKHIDFDRLDVLPASFMDALEEFLSSVASPNFTITLVNPTTIQVPAGPGDDEVSVGIDGLFRYNVAPASAAHPGGAAGTYDIWVTTGDNVFTSTPYPDTDLTDYSFGLAIRFVGSPPTAAHSRKVGTVLWDGSAITRVTQTFGQSLSTLELGAPLWIVLAFS